MSSLKKGPDRSLDYLQTKANPPHPFTKVEAVAPEAVVNYRKGATTKALLGD